MFRKTFLVLLLILYPLIAFAQVETSFPRLSGDEEGLKRVLIDFTEIASRDLFYDYGASLGIQLEGAEADQLKQSYNISNWKVSVQSSLQYPQVLEKSQVKAANVTGGVYQGEQVLGVRTYFPDYNYEMAIEIQPPYSPFNTISQREFDPFGPYKGIGYLDNVGDIYKATITVYGLRQEEHIFVVTEDSDGNTYEYPFGALNFIGWRELVWENPDYLIKDTSTRINLPIYPQYSSDLVLKSVKVVHSSYHKNPDFVTYVRDINVIVDQAETSIDNDIENEEIWNIINENTYEKRSTQIKALDMQLYFDFLEKRKAWDYSLNNLTNSDTSSVDNGN